MATIPLPPNIFRERLSERTRKLKNQTLLIGAVLFLKLITEAHVKSVFFLSFEGGVKEANIIILYSIVGLFYFLMTNFVILAMQDWRNSKLAYELTFLYKMEQSIKVVSDQIQKVNEGSVKNFEDFSTIFKNAKKDMQDASTKDLVQYWILDIIPITLLSVVNLILIFKYEVLPVL